MATPYTAGMPYETPLTNGCTVQFVAIDPVTGDAVSGVTISNTSIWYESSGLHAGVTSGPFMLVAGPEA